MAYRNKNNKDSAIDVVSTIFGFIITFFLIFGFFYSIGNFIKKNFFIISDNTFYWLFYIISIAVFIGFVSLIIILSKKVKLRLEEFKIRNTYCKHNIKGGQTLELCAQCKDEKEKDQQRYELKIKEELIRKSIKEKALELRNEEIIRFTKMSLTNKEFLYNISPNEFEDVIAEMYKKLGYDVKQTPYSNDKGKDIILIKDGMKYLVECKRYDFTNTIGREALQKFFAAIIEDKAEKGFFITTSDYKSTAIQYAKDINKIELINGNKLILMMREIYPENYNSNLVKIMCSECGDIVEFTFKSNDQGRSCKKGHLVQNDFDTEVLSPKYLGSDKYCIKCGKAMKLVNWKGKSFWGCSNYPSCRSYQRYITAN